MKPFSSLVPANGMMYMGFPGLPTGGTAWFVDPYYGADGNAGRRPDKPFKTLAKAHDVATADQNDIVYMLARSNTATYTTDYQSATLDWNKDAVHLIGVNAGSRFSPRSRVAFASTYATASNLFTVSAKGCMFANLEFFAGVASATPTGGCMKLTGMRNHFVNCHIAGIGNDLMDKAGAYDLWFYDSAENYFENCVIGIDTVKRGTAANYGMLFTTAAGVGSARTIFRGCLFPAWCESAGNYLFVSANQANALDRFLLFDNCVLHNVGAAVAGGAQMTQAMQIHAAANGHVILHNTTIVGADNVNASDTGLILCGSGSFANNTEATDLGLAVVTTNA